MIEPHEVRELLRRFCLAGDGPPPSGDGKICVAGFASALASKWPSEPTTEEWAGLNALCRKLSVAKVLRQEYELDWKTAGDAAPLTHAMWQSLVAVLIAYGSRQAVDGQSRGLHAKLLNAAFVALDHLGGESDIATAELLGDAARRSLDDALPGRDS